MQAHRPAVDLVIAELIARSRSMCGSLFPNINFREPLGCPLRKSLTCYACDLALSSFYNSRVDDLACRCGSTPSQWPTACTPSVRRRTSPSTQIRMMKQASISRPLTTRTQKTYRLRSLTASRSSSAGSRDHLRSSLGWMLIDGLQCPETRGLRSRRGGSPGAG